MRKALLLVLLVSASAAAADKVDPAVERFREQLAKLGSTDPEKFRLEVAGFVRTKVGTPASPQAANVLRQLPSPLDRLDPQNIPELDRFGWQPKELVAVLGEHRGRQGASVTCVAWTPDGRFIISGGAQGYIRFWDPVTLRQVARVSTSGAPTSLSVSTDSKVLAAGTSAGTVHVWDIADREPKGTGTFTIATSPVHSVHISHDGKLLAAGVYDNLIHTWDLDGSKAKERTQLSGHKSAVRAVQFAPDSKLFAAAAADGSIRFWSFQGEKITELGSLAAHTGAISCLLYPSRGGALMAGCDDGNVIRVIIGAKFTRGAVFKTPAAVTAIAYTPRTGLLTTSHADGVVRVWGGGAAAAMPKPTATVEGHFGSVAGFAWSPAGNQMATGGSDWTVRLWGMGGVKGAERYPLKGHWMGPPAVAFSPDALLIGSASGDHTARTWDVAKPAPAQTGMFPPFPSLHKGEGSALSSLAFTPDSKSLAVSGAGTAVRFWDVVKRTQVRTYTAPAGNVGSLVFTPDGRSLFAASRYLVFGWGTESGKEIARVTAPDRYLNGLALSADARFALAGTGYYVIEKGKPLIKDGKNVYQDIGLRAYDIRQVRLLHEKTDFPVPMGPVSFLPDGRGVCGLWSTAPSTWTVSREAMKEEKSLKGFGSLGHPYIVSPDQRRVVFGNAGLLRLIDFEKETILKSWPLDETIYSYAFSPDGRYLAVSLVTGPIYVLRLDDPPPSGK